jgi:hypothetical protein
MCSVDPFVVVTLHSKDILDYLWRMVRKYFKKDDFEERSSDYRATPWRGIFVSKLEIVRFVKNTSPLVHVKVRYVFAESRKRAIS